MRFAGGLSMRPRGIPMGGNPSPGSICRIRETFAMTKHNSDENKEPLQTPKHPPKLTKRKLESFLSSICEAGGNVGETRPTLQERGGAHSHIRGLTCQGPCAKAEWRGHLDIPGGNPVRVRGLVSEPSRGTAPRRHDRTHVYGRPGETACIPK
jgi:hypothetical protein